MLIELRVGCVEGNIWNVNGIECELCRERGCECNLN